SILEGRSAGDRRDRFTGWLADVRSALESPGGSVVGTGDHAGGTARRGAGRVRVLGLPLGAALRFAGAAGDRRRRVLRLLADDGLCRALDAGAARFRENRVINAERGERPACRRAG